MEEEHLRLSELQKMLAEEGVPRTRSALLQRIKRKTLRASWDERHEEWTVPKSEALRLVESLKTRRRMKPLDD